MGDDVRQQRYEDKGTEVIQEHPRASSTPPPSRPAGLHSPDRPSHLDHHADTTLHASHGTSSRTRVPPIPPTDGYRTPPGGYDMLHSFSAGGARDCCACTCTWPPEAVPSKRCCAAEPRAHPCLRVLCMTACREDGPRNAYPLSLFSRLRTAKGCSLLPRLSC